MSIFIASKEVLNHDAKCLTLTHFVCNTKLRFDFWILYHILSSLNWWICWKEGVAVFNLGVLAYDIISSYQAVCTLHVVFDAEASLFTMSFTLTEPDSRLVSRLIRVSCTTNAFWKTFCKIKLHCFMDIPRYFQSEMSSWVELKVFKLFSRCCMYRGI